MSTTIYDGGQYVATQFGMGHGLLGVQISGDGVFIAMPVGEAINMAAAIIEFYKTRDI